MAKEASCKVCATYQVKYLVLRSTTRNQRLAYLPPDMACETLKRLHIVAPLPLHYQLHPALAPALSHILLLDPHMRNERRPPFLPRPGPDSGSGASSGSRFRCGAGPGIRSTQQLGLLASSSAGPRVPPGGDDVGPASVRAPGIGYGCYSHCPGVGLASERTQNLLQGACGRHAVEALAERCSRREEAVERGAAWACDVLAKTTHR